MDSARAGVGLKRKGAARALGSHSEVFSHHHCYSRWGILLISVEWLKCGIGKSTFHRLRWCFAIQACFDHSIRILLCSSSYLSLYRRERVNKSSPAPSGTAAAGLTPVFQGLMPFSLEDPALPPAQIQFVVLHLTHTHRNFCFASARLKLHRPDAESSSRFSIYLEKSTLFIAKLTLVLESSTHFCSCYC